MSSRSQQDEAAAFHVAARRGDLHRLQAFLADGIHVDAVVASPSVATQSSPSLGPIMSSRTRLTALVWATLFGHAQLVEVLLFDHNASTHFGDNMGCPLLFASRKEQRREGGNMKMVRDLLLYNVSKTFFGTPL